MIRKILPVLMLLALALPASSALEFIPCAVGNKWEFETVKLMRATVSHQGRTVGSMKDASSGSSVYEVVSVDAKANPPVYDYAETCRIWPVNGGEGDTDKTELKLASDAGGLRILSIYTDNAQSKKTDKQAYNPPLLYFSAKDAQAGKPWEVGTMREEDAQNPMTGRTAARETVTVPAGTFKNCLKVVYSGDNITGTIEMWEKTFTITSGKSRGIYWVADGVGVVKELEISTMTAEATGPDGASVTVESAACTVSELKPGYVVKK